MASISSPPVAPEWASTALRFVEAWGGPVLVLGDRAGDLAQAYHRSGAPPVIVDRPGLAYLSSGTEQLPDDASPAATGLPPGSVSLVTLRRAWSDGASLGAACREAQRILTPGGHLLVTDFDADTLLDQAPHRYPLQLVYRQVPEAAARLRASYHQVRLPLQVMAGGFRDIVTDLVDETLGRFATADQYAEFVRTEVADRLVGMTKAQATAALENLARVLPGVVRGAIVHREPWALVAAVNPG